MLYKRCEVVRVIDGDTVVADMYLGMRVWIRGVHIRLNAINTPELNGPDREKAVIARKYLETLVLKQTVGIETFDDRLDKYGRLVASIILQDGYSVNRIMIEKGFAVPFIGDMFAGVEDE